MDGPRAVLGLLLVGGGAVGVRYAHVLARWGEQVDAIGSTRSWDEVEPATWKVTVVLLGALLVTVIGLFALVSAVI